MPLPSISCLRAVFDPLHPDTRLRRLTICFDEEAEAMGLLQWIQQEQVPLVKGWLHEEANKEAFRQVDDDDAPQQAARSLQDIRLRLPFVGDSVCLEAARLSMRGVTLADEVSEDGSGSEEEEDSAAGSLSDATDDQGIKCAAVEFSGITMIHSKGKSARKQARPLRSIGEEGAA